MALRRWTYDKIIGVHMCRGTFLHCRDDTPWEHPCFLGHILWGTQSKYTCHPHQHHQHQTVSRRTEDWSRMILQRCANIMTLLHYACSKCLYFEERIVPIFVFHLLSIKCHAAIITDTGQNGPRSKGSLVKKAPSQKGPQSKGPL